MSIEELVTDLRARINDVVGSGWLSMTLGMVGFFGAYYVLFVLIMRETGVTLPLNLLFAAFAIGRLLTAVGITPGGMGITETATSAVLVAWGADAAGATAGVVLFSIFTHLMEVPLGALGWLLWTASTKVEPPTRATSRPSCRPPADPGCGRGSVLAEEDHRHRGLLAALAERVVGEHLLEAGPVAGHVGARARCGRCRWRP